MEWFHLVCDSVVMTNGLMLDHMMLSMLLKPNYYLLLLRIQFKVCLVCCLFDCQKNICDSRLSDRRNHILLPVLHSVCDKVSVLMVDVKEQFNVALSVQLVLPFSGKVKKQFYESSKQYGRLYFSSSYNTCIEWECHFRVVKVSRYCMSKVKVSPMLVFKTILDTNLTFVVLVGQG